MNSSALFLAVFLACVVEGVEALTIVLAAGTARHWRSAMPGVLGGMVVLAFAVAALGPAVSAIPLGGHRRPAVDLRAAMAPQGDSGPEDPARPRRHLPTESATK